MLQRGSVSQRGAQPRRLFRREAVLLHESIEARPRSLS
jgi:hypothetical protein